MNFEDIKKIVDKEGKVIILENQKAYIVSRYVVEEIKESMAKEVKPREEEKKEGLKLEDLPF